MVGNLEDGLPAAGLDFCPTPVFANKSNGDTEKQHHIKFE
jgi:hypothetical protein